MFLKITKRLILLAAFVCSQSFAAAQNQNIAVAPDTTNYSIPFIYAEGRSPSLLTPSALAQRGMVRVTRNNQPVSPSNTNYIPSEQIISQTKKIRQSLCTGASKADIRVWLTTDASGKIFGIGVGGQTGVEVTFHC